MTQNQTSGSHQANRLVASYVNHLIVEKGRSKNTVAAYQRDLDRYLEFCSEAGKELTQISRQDIDTFIIHCRKGGSSRPALSETSTARVLASIRGLHRFLVFENIAETDPTQSVKPPKAPKKLPQTLSPENVLALIDAPNPEDPAGSRDRALLEFLYSTGARITEAVDLDIDDYTQAKESGVIVLTGKGNKQRIAPLGQFALAAIDAYLVRTRPAFATEGTGTPALFLNSKGRRLTRQSAYAIIKSAAKKANLDELYEISPHTLRHSYATHLLNGGADVRVVQELLGHASVTTTQLYTHVTRDAMREVFMTSHPRAVHG